MIKQKGLKLLKQFKISKIEKEILDLITIEFLTVKQIALRRDTSLNAVYKIIKKLKQKGVYDAGFNRVEKVESTKSLNPLFQRLHGQEFNIKIIKKSDKYFHAKQRGNTQFIDGNTLRLFNDSIEIYSGQSFFEKDEQRATATSLAYWQRFMARLEHEFDIILIKPRVQNINLVNQHYGEIDSEMAKDSLNRKEKIKIQTEDDGKIWFLIDNSWNLKEMETIHPETAKQDMTKVQKQVNDWRLNNPPTNSELSTNLNNLIKVATDDMIKREEYSNDIVEHKEAIKILGKSINKLTKVIGGVLIENRNLKLANKHQTSLNDF